MKQIKDLRERQVSHEYIRARWPRLCALAGGIAFAMAWGHLMVGVTPRESVKLALAAQAPPSPTPAAGGVIVIDPRATPGDAVRVIPAATSTPVATPPASDAVATPTVTPVVMAGDDGETTETANPAGNISDNPPEATQPTPEVETAITEEPEAERPLPPESAPTVVPVDQASAPAAPMVEPEAVAEPAPVALDESTASDEDLAEPSGSSVAELATRFPRTGDAPPVPVMGINGLALIAAGLALRRWH